MVKINLSLFSQTILVGTFLVLVGSVFFTWPDNKLHIYFCEVGQGDATYIRFPGNRDMLIDGGPNSSAVLNCLGRAMPFYDRTIDVVALTHPQADHLSGLVDVAQRYTIKNFFTVEIGNAIGEYQALARVLQQRHIPITFLWAGEEMHVGKVKLSILWPSQIWFKTAMPTESILIDQQKSLAQLMTTDDLNHFSLYIGLQFGDFDALFTGDGDISVQNSLLDLGLFSSLPQQIEVLKVPHHGSKTGMISQFVQLVQPRLSVIEVGAKNNYGHPNLNVISQLSNYGKVLRTDKSGIVEVKTDGKTWQYKSER